MIKKCQSIKWTGSNWEEQWKKKTKELKKKSVKNKESNLNMVLQREWKVNYRLKLTYRLRKAFLGVRGAS